MTLLPTKHGMGWLPDYPDHRDYTVATDALDPRLRGLGETRTVADMLRAAGATPKAALPPSVDLHAHCSHVEDQGTLGSCTAHAGVGLVEYYERKVYGRHIDASRLFLYRMTRLLMGMPGDSGAFLRTTMGAMRLFGVPPESYWPYDVRRFDDEPSAFLYAFAKEYQSVQYFRLDPPGVAADKVLRNVKLLLSRGIPSMFGFTVYQSIEQAEDAGDIPFPTRDEKVVGGHAVVAVGYDDARVIGHWDTSETTKGALLVRNSWGRDWGEKGYGWLPYEYVLKGLAED